MLLAAHKYLVTDIYIVWHIYEIFAIFEINETLDADP